MANHSTLDHGWHENNHLIHINDKLITDSENMAKMMISDKVTAADAETKSNGVEYINAI